MNLSSDDIYNINMETYDHYNQLSQEEKYSMKERESFIFKRKIISNLLKCDERLYTLFFTNKVPVTNNMFKFEGVWDKCQLVGYGSHANILRPKRGLVDRYVLKCPSNYFTGTDGNKLDFSIDEMDDIVTHEIFISLILSSSIYTTPNIVKLRGIFRAHRAKIKSDNIHIRPNIFSDIVTYAIYDYVDAKTLYEVLKDEDDINLGNILNWYLQILLTLETLSPLNFSHNDLNLKNIMLFKLKKPTNITYNVSGTKYVLKVNYIAKMIDFGYSYLEFNNRKYGTYDMYEHHIYHNRPNKISDAFKLFISLFWHLYYDFCEGPNDNILRTMITRKLEPIFKFFMDADLEEYIKIIQSYTIPHIPKTNYQHINLIKYILEYYPIIKKDIVIE